MNKRLLISASVVFLLLIGLGALYITPRSDEWFAQKFRGNKRELEELAMLLETNGVDFVQRSFERRDVLIQGCWSKTRTEVSKLSADGAALHRLFDAIGCDYVSRTEHETTIYLPRHGWEDLYPGGYKAFVLRDSPPVLVVNSIDEHRRRNIGRYGFYRSLEGSWYLKYLEAH